MSKRVCSTPGCPTLVDVGTRDGRCDPCRRARDKARGTTGQRGYGPGHTKIRDRWQRRLDAGEVIHCWRCRTRGKLTCIDPRRWTLGHCDTDRTSYHGPECVSCQYATAGRVECPHPDHAGAASRRISRGA